MALLEDSGKSIVPELRIWYFENIANLEECFEESSVK